MLPLFPQRDSEIADSPDREEFWGIYAMEQPSAFRVIVWNAMSMLPCFVFFFMWLFAWGHVGDLQNAAVPISLSFSFVTMFWGSYFLGVL